MALQRLLSGDPARNSMVYLAIGGLSLAKAIAVRNDRDRFRRELLDAALFIGIGLVLRRYGKVKAAKRAELREAIPEWAADLLATDSRTGGGGVRGVLGGDGAAESDRSVAARARRALPV